MNSPQSNHENGTQPDPDAIKMFVGQVPRSMDENDLTKMFEQYGPVHQLNVLRDKVSGQSKGCCFVTFYTRKAALDAQNALHNIKTMPGMHHPVQMKPADSEKRNGEQHSEERKLFIGMLSKKLAETDVKMMFAPFGNIEDCTVLRDQNGQSRGCAFITYSNRQSAQNCIKNMHHSQTMEGCSSPLVVKFADTQKEKEQKKLQQMNSNMLMQFGGGGTGGGGMGGGMNNIGPQYIALLQQAMASGNMGMFANMGNLGGLNSLNLPQLLTALAAASNNPGLLAALAALASSNSGGNNNSSASNSSSSNTAAGDASNNMHIQNLQGLAALANATNNPGGFNAMNMQGGGNGMQGSGNMGSNNMPGGNSNMAAALAAQMQYIQGMQGNNMGGNMQGNNMGGNMQGNMGNNMGGGMGNNMGRNMGNMQGNNMGNMGNNMGRNMGSMPGNNMGNMGNNNMGNLNVGGNMPGNINGNNMDVGMERKAPNMGGNLQQGGGDSASNNQSVSLSGSLSTSNSSLSGFAGLQNLGNNNMAATSMSPGVTNGLNNGTSGMDALSQAYSGIQQYAGLSGLLSPTTASFPNAFSTQAAPQLQAANTPAGKQTEGPDGANLFIYHLPQEFSDQDLMQTFMPFGSVISSKVFIDKQTNLSKCFGFVSYDNAVSSQAAIAAMNGFQIGMKRLKVQLKRPKNDSKPY